MRMKIKAGTKVRHRDNGGWLGVGVSDLSPRCISDGWLLVEHHPGGGIPPRVIKMRKFLMIESCW